MVVFSHSTIRPKHLRMKIPALNQDNLQGPPLVWPEPRRSIVNLLSSLALGLGGRATGHPPLESISPEWIHSHRQVVLLVIDGLGTSQLRAHVPGGLLHSALRDEVTSVFPSTTASAVTTLMTGLSPREHGLVGWHMYFRELGAVLAVLPGRPRYGGSDWQQSGVDVSGLLGLSPFTARIQMPSTILSPANISASKFNRAIRGPAEVLPFSSRDDFFEILASRCLKTRGRAYHYAYWSEFDHLAHEEGAFSLKARAHLQDFERRLERFLKKIRGSETLLIITADHGFMDHDPAEIIILEHYPEIASHLLLPLTGEARAAYAFVRSGHNERFEQDVQDLLSDRVSMFRSEDLIAAGVFGDGAQHERLCDRVGDYTLIPRGRGILRDRLFGEKTSRMVGVHGGVSADEMWVPVIPLSA